MQRIGLLATSYPRTPTDPAGGFVAGHADALRALGHEVDVIAAGDGAAATADGTTRIPSPLFYRGGAPDLLERAPLRATAPAAASFTLRLAAAAARACRARAWDAIITHWLVPSALAALPLAPPLFAIAHGGDVHTLRRLRLLAPVLHALHRRGARLAFVSAELLALARAAAPRLAAWLDTDALVQPMGLDLARFAAIPRAAAPASSPPLVLIAARLVPIKGVDVALAALAHVTAPLRLVIAGDGPERPRLARLAPPHATFLGEVDTAHRDRLLGEAALVVVPSRVLPNRRAEGTPTIALEALAAGVPVISSAPLPVAAAHPVPPGDPRALAAAIDAALRAPPPPAAALRRAVEHLAWPAVALRLLRRG